MVNIFFCKRNGYKAEPRVTGLFEHLNTREICNTDLGHRIIPMTLMISTKRKPVCIQAIYSQVW